MVVGVAGVPVVVVVGVDVGGVPVGVDVGGVPVGVGVVVAGVPVGVPVTGVGGVPVGVGVVDPTGVLLGGTIVRTMSVGGVGETCAYTVGAPRTVISGFT